MKRSALLAAWMGLLVGLSLIAKDEEKNPAGKIPFEVYPGEPLAIGFAVTEPGPISVEATWKGAALSVSLTGPLSKPIEKSGKGSAKVEYVVTAEDVKRSGLWTVTLREERPGKADAKAKAAAAGEVILAHPAADMKRVEGERKALKEKSQDAAKKGSAEGARKSQEEFQTKTAQAQKQVKDLQISVATEFRKKFGAKAASGNNPQPANGPPATITSISVNQGQPGDPVLVGGTNFNSGTQVFFLVSRDQKLQAQVEIWSDHQLMAYVPDATGIQAFDGGIYPKSGGVNGDLTPFRFVPMTDFAVFEIPASWQDDSHMSNNPNLDDTPDASGQEIRNSRMADYFTGFRGDDEFFRLLRLKNGWVVDTVTFRKEVEGWGDAYVSDSRTGTDSLYASVHLWGNPIGTRVTYHISWTIKGPKGVPYR